MENKFNPIIALLLAALTVFISINIYMIFYKTNEVEYSYLISDLNTVIGEFSHWIMVKEEMLDTAKDIVDNQTYEDVISMNTGNLYLNINNDDPDVTQVYIGLTSGEFVTGGQWVPPSDYDPRTRVWYKKAFAADETIISQVYIDRETGDEMVTVSSPLYFEDVFVGIISADIFLNHINEFMKDLLSKVSYYAYLLDESGTILVHTDRDDLVGLNLYDDFRNDVYTDYFEQSQKTDAPVEIAYDFDGNHILGIGQKVPGLDMHIVVATIQHSGLSVVKVISPGMIVFNILVIGIIIMLITLIFRAKKELDSQNKQLKTDNEHDFLTGIYNRRYFNLLINKLWEDLDKNTDISLLMVDIDYFKQYNDTYGHLKGDEALQAVTSAIASHIRKEDIFARYGGEEFTLLFPGLPKAKAEQIARTLIAAVYDACIMNEQSPYNQLTISVGVASIASDADCSITDFINQADKALYIAKEDGRNRYHTLSCNAESMIHSSQ